MGRNLAEFPFRYNIGEKLLIVGETRNGFVVDRIECNKLDKDISTDDEATLFDDYKIVMTSDNSISSWYETWELRRLG